MSANIAISKGIVQNELNKSQKVQVIDKNLGQFGSLHLMIKTTQKTEWLSTVEFTNWLEENEIIEEYCDETGVFKYTFEDETLKARYSDFMQFNVTDEMLLDAVLDLKEEKELKLSIEGSQYNHIAYVRSNVPYATWDADLKASLVNTQLVEKVTFISPYHSQILLKVAKRKGDTSQQILRRLRKVIS